MSEKKGTGASIERGLLRRKLKRMETAGASGGYSSGYALAIGELREWLDAQPARLAKRRGGLGRR